MSLRSLFLIGVFDDDDLLIKDGDDDGESPLFLKVIGGVFSKLVIAVSLYSSDTSYSFPFPFS